MRNTLAIRFAASESATNKALQEVRVLGGFGLIGGHSELGRGAETLPSLFRKVHMVFLAPA
jgi:hypothetical protein